MLLDDFRREDLAATIVANSVLTFVNYLYKRLEMEGGIQHVFLTGGFTHRQFIKDHFTEMWAGRAGISKFMSGIQVQRGFWAPGRRRRG